MQRRLWPAGLGAAALLLTVTAAVPVQAQQSARSLEDRLQRIESDLQMLQRDVYGGSRPASAPARVDGAGEVSGAALERMDVRLTQLENELRELTGALEEATFRIDRLAEELEKFTRETDLRFQELEGRHAAGAAGPPSGPTGQGAENGQQVVLDERGPGTGVLGTLPVEDLERLSDPNAPEQPRAAPSGAGAETAALLPPGATPEEQYQHAFKLLRTGDYAVAEQAFAAFLERHPDHKLAGNARYWLGETYYVRGDYERAAITFLEGYQNHRDGNKAPDSLLKLALALRSLEKTREACAALARLQKEFPNASPSIERRAEAERQRLACE